MRRRESTVLKPIDELETLSNAIFWRLAFFFFFFLLFSFPKGWRSGNGLDIIIYLYLV